MILAGGLPPRQHASAAGGLTLPAGFVDEVVIPGLLSPRDFVFTPDGRILIAERGSASSSDINVASIRVFKNGALLPTRAVTLDVCGDGERGLLGLALDPNFSSNGYLYVYYTRQAAERAELRLRNLQPEPAWAAQPHLAPHHDRRHDRPGQRGRADRQHARRIQASTTPAIYTSARTATCMPPWATRV